MDAITYMSIQEFVDFGFLQEVNRQFFHPLGLALEVFLDESGIPIRLGGVWDYRNDPEGITFGKIDIQKVTCVLELQTKKAAERQERLGYVIQTKPGDIFDFTGDESDE